MDYYVQLLREESAGKYKGYKYPNLIEVQKHSCLYIGQFANVTEELILAAFRGEEELTIDEIRKVARYNGIPFSVLTCPKVIMLDMGRWKHKKMVAEVVDLYIRLKCMARKGNRKAEEYLKFADWKQFFRSNRKWCKRRGSSLQCQNCFFVYPIIDSNLKNLAYKS